MATEVIYTLDPGGGKDYTSFVTALADIDLIDWVTTDQIPVIEFYGAGDIAEFVSIDIDNTDATHPVIIRPASGEWTNGQLGTGVRIAKGRDYGGIVECARYVEIYGLEIENTYGYGYGLEEKPSQELEALYVVGCRIIANRSRGGLIHDYGAHFISCLMVGKGVYDGGGYSANYANCLAVNGVEGFESISYESLRIVCKNCVAYGNTKAYDDETESTAASYNNASDQYSTRGDFGTSGLGQDVVAGDFTDAANDDYSLSPTSALAGAGADLSGVYGARWLDIQGNAFDPLNPPIGPYQLAAAGTVLTPETLAQSQAIAQPVITALTALNAASLAQGQLLEEVALNKKTVLPNSLEQAQALEPVSIVMSTGLVPGELLQQQLLEAVSIATGTGLAPVGLQQEQTLAEPAVYGGTSISANVLLQVQALNTVAVSASTTLLGASLVQSQALEGVSVLADTLVVGDDLVQTQEVGNVTINATTALTGEKLVSAQSIEDGSVWIGGVVPSSLEQAQMLNTVSLVGGELLAGASVIYTVDASRLKYLVN